MTELDPDKIDPDIEETDLSEIQKAVVQLYRNFDKKVTARRKSILCKEIDAEEFDPGPLARVVSLIENEDVRFVPVVGCSYADDQLREMFRRHLSKHTPGGLKDLLGANGPLGNLSNRIRIAYAFNALSPFILIELDKLRRARNTISHSWDIGSFRDIFEQHPAKELVPAHQIIRDALRENPDLKATTVKVLSADLSLLTPEAAFRINVIWMLTMLTYEAPIHMRARKQLLNPFRVLYEDPTPQRFKSIARIAASSTNRIAATMPCVDAESEL